MKTSTLLALTLAIVAARPLAAGAGCPQDHLKCHKIKDTIAKGVATKDLSSFYDGTDATGCVVKIPPKMACVPTCKTPSDPPAGDPLYHSFLCYKVKCPKQAPAPLPLLDQFGTHSVTLSTTKLLCVPACLPEGAPCLLGAHCCGGVCSGGTCRQG